MNAPLHAAERARINAAYGAPCAPADADGVPPLVDPGPRRWHALTVAPQRETEVEGWLARQGVYAFHPVLMVSRRRAGRLVVWPRRYLPGYVFARFDGAPRCHLIRAHRHITGALARADGEWGILDPAGLRAIHAMRDRHRAALLGQVAASARRRAGTPLVPGGMALFRAGVFAGQRVEVVELVRDGGAMVRLRLFGSDMLAEARVADLVALHG
jgi:transcription antitermination factor NusG